MIAFKSLLVLIAFAGFNTLAHADEDVAACIQSCNAAAASAMGGGDLSDRESCAITFENLDCYHDCKGEYHDGSDYETCHGYSYSDLIHK